MELATLLAAKEAHIPVTTLRLAGECGVVGAPAPFCARERSRAAKRLSHQPAEMVCVRDKN